MAKEDTVTKKLEVPERARPRSIEEPSPPRGLEATTGNRLLDIPGAVELDKEYILERQPDGRYRIIGTSPEGKVTLLPEKEVEVDNRVRVTNTTNWPWRVQGHLIMTYPDGQQYIGSGTMVNKHHVLTAGHNVYSEANGGWATSIEFHAAQNDNTLPYGSVLVTRLLSFRGWTEDQDDDWDMGMLILESELGDHTGWMGVISTTDENLDDHEITVAGYPGDKGGRQLWRSTEKIVTVNAETIQYDAYTTGGMSGAGVFGVWEGVEDEHQCASHMQGPNGTPNEGCRVSSEKYRRLVEWMNTY